MLLFYTVHENLNKHISQPIASGWEVCMCVRLEAGLQNFETFLHVDSPAWAHQTEYCRMG